MRVDITNDNIKLSHSVRDIDEESNGTSNLNTELNANDEENINIPDWEYDKAGHIIKKKSHTYTLPFGFKTIKTNGRNNENESENAISSPVIDDVVADHTQDILTLNSGNKWIRIDTDTNNDTLAFSHDIHDVNLDKEPGTTSLSNENSDEVRFIIPTDTYDKAGHFVSRQNETYIMPFGYGKIIGDEGNTAASATFDTLTLNTGDEWLTTKTTKDMVTFYHDYPAKIDDSISSLDMNKVDISNNEKNQITLETLVRDEKGHVAKVNQHTVTLPYGYKTFQDSNADVGVSIADNTQDVFTFKGDSWVRPTVSKDLVIFEHIGPVSTSATAKNNIVNPEFGSTFTIEDWHYDDKGHKNNLTTHTIQFPKGSLTAADSNGADVITQLSFVPTTGALTTSRTNINNLLLTDYIKLVDDSDINSTDTLGAALSKLQTQVIKEKNRINELNLLDSSVDNKYISAINQNNGQISVTRTNFPDFILRSEVESLINELKLQIKELTDKVNEIHPPEPEPEEEIE